MCFQADNEATMKCKTCKEKAIVDDPRYCKDHFVEFVEQTVFSTISTYQLIGKNDNVAVAASLVLFRLSGL